MTGNSEMTLIGIQSCQIHNGIHHMVDVTLWRSEEKIIIVYSVNSDGTTGSYG